MVIKTTNFSKNGYFISWCFYDLIKKEGSAYYEANPRSFVYLLGLTLCCYTLSI